MQSSLVPNAWANWMSIKLQFHLVLPCESIKTQHFLIVCCLQNRAWIWANVTWLGRVILSNYFDTTLRWILFYKWRNRSRYCDRRKNTLCQLLHGEWMRDSVKETNDTKFWHGLFRSFCLLFIHPWKDDPQNGIKIFEKISSTTPYHIHRYLPSNLKTMNHWKVLRFNWLTL